MTDKTGFNKVAPNRISLTHRLSKQGINMQTAEKLEAEYFWLYNSSNLISFSFNLFFFGIQFFMFFN